MEKKEFILRTSKKETGFFELLSLNPITERIARTSAARHLANLYSFLLEKEVTPLQTVHYFYAQLMLCATFLPYSIDLGWRALFFTLFCQALRRT